MRVHSCRKLFLRVLLFSLSIGVVSVTLTNPAYAEISIAVVDVEAILESSKAAKSIKKQVDKRRKTFLKSVKDEEDKLRTEQKAIEEKREGMSKEELLKKAQAFEKRRIEARNKLREKKAALDKSYSKAMNKLTESITHVCQTIADEQKIDLIITRQNIIIGTNNLDITSKVMKKMNKEISSLPLE